MRTVSNQLQSETQIEKSDLTSAQCFSRVKPSTSEWVIVLLLCLVFIGLNLLTYNRYPNVWCDEVWFSEPAVNFILHGSFTTTTWQLQPPHTFPAVNCPLYSLSLVPWLKVMGTTLLAIRSFNYVLMALAGILVWAISWRLGLVRKPLLRFCLLLVVFSGYGISFAYRSSRPDILGLISILLIALCLQLRKSSWKSGLLLVLGALTVWTGLQVTLFACFACAMVWWLFRSITRRELLVIGAGMAIGVFSLLFLFQNKGVLPYFLPMVAGWLGKRYIHASELSLSTRALTVLRASLSSCFDDFSALALTGGTLVLLLAAWNRLTAITRRLVGCMLVLTLATPLLFNLVGHFAFYYSYLRFIPAAVAFFTVWSELAEHAAACSNQQPFGFATFLSYLTVYASFLAAICLGLPMRLGVSAASARLSPRPELQATINASIHTNDVVFMDHAPFFEVKRVAAVVYDKNYSSTFLHEHIQGHDFTPEEKRSISILIIRPDQAQFTTNFFGGEWQAIGAPFGDSQDFSQLARLPLIGSELAHYGTQPQTERYRLQILRRLP